MENKSRGMACVFSLKNPTFPEYICLSSCAILCLDVNPYHPHMLAVGLMNGNVAVYNLQIKTKQPTYISDSINGKHRNLINQVNNPRGEILHKQYLLFFDEISGTFRYTLLNLYLRSNGQKMT